MKIGSVFQGDYLKAADLSRGERLHLTISEVVMVELDDGEKPVVHFKESKKGLVLNKTNASMITEIAGTDETDDWSGIQVCLYSTKVDYAGKRVDALRIDYPDNNKPPVYHVNGNGNAKAVVADGVNYKTRLTEKLKAYAAEKGLVWDKDKFELIRTYAGTVDFAALTQEQARQACENVDNPNYLPF